MKTVLIAGATGYLGRYVVQEFKRQGYRVRVLSRTAAKAADLREFIDDLFIGEVTDPDSIRGICHDIDIVFSSIGITRQKDNLTYMDVDYHGNINLLKEAQKAGVSRFIYTSVFNADKMKHLKGVKAKLRFEHALKASGMDYTIVYPNGFFSDMLDYLDMAINGRGYLFGSGNNRINPIHGSDLAEICVNAANGTERELCVGGPDSCTHIEILNLAFKACGETPKITRIPIWLRNIALQTIRIFTPVKIYGPMEFFMTVLAMDMVAPLYGRFHLEDFFTREFLKTKSVTKVTKKLNHGGSVS